MEMFFRKCGGDQSLKAINPSLLQIEDRIFHLYDTKLNLR